MNIHLKQSDESGMKAEPTRSNILRQIGPELPSQTKAPGTRPEQSFHFSNLAKKRNNVLALALAVLANAGCGSAGSSADAGNDFNKPDAMADAVRVDSRAPDSANDVCTIGTVTGVGVFGCGVGPVDAGKDAPKDTNVQETSKESGPDDTGTPDAPKDTNVQETSKEAGPDDTGVPETPTEAGPVDAGIPDALKDSNNPDANLSCDKTGSFEFDPSMNEYVYELVNPDGSIVPFPESTQDGKYSIGKCGNSPKPRQHMGVWSLTSTLIFTTPTMPLNFKLHCSSYPSSNPPTLEELYNDLEADGGWGAPNITRTGTTYTVNAFFCPSGAEFLIGF
jgi:hypothetical protein